LPTSTGVGSQKEVLIADASGQKARDLGQTTGSISDGLFAAAAQDHVTQATLSATLQLNDLSVEMAKEDPMVALQTMKPRADEIYQGIAPGLSVAARESFDKTWAALSSNSQIKMQADGIKRGKQKLEANLETALNGFERGVKTENGITSKITLMVADAEGVKAIQNAVRNNVIDADVGARRIVKFRSNIAKNAVAGWINRTPKDRLINRYDNMDEGVFPDTEEGRRIAMHWSQLTEVEKEQQRQKVATELRSLQALKDKKEREDNKDAKNAQQALAGTLFNRIAGVQRGELPDTELPTLEGLEELKRQKLITGDQQIQLGKMIVALDEPETSPVDLLDLREKLYAVSRLPQKDQQAAADTIMASVRSMALRNGIEKSHVSSLSGLKDKILQREFKNSPQARARTSLKRILGAQDPEFQVSSIDQDPQKAARVQNALNEFDDRIDAEEDPWAVHRDLIERATIEVPELSTFVRPKYSDKPVTELKAEDIPKIRDKTNEKLRSRAIDIRTYKREMERLQRIEHNMTRRHFLSRSSGSGSGSGGGDRSNELERRLR
jgi:hypothetical protein